MTAIANQPPGIAPVRREGRTFAIALALAVVLLGIGVLAWLVITPGKSAGDASAVSAAFLGYTNNPAGKQVVVFSINNRSPLAIRRQWYYEVQVLTNGTWKPQPTVHVPFPLAPMIPPNRSEVWTIDAPKAEGRYRVWFPYVEDHGRLAEMKKTIRRKLRGVGLPFKDSDRSYMGLTEEVEPPSAQ